MSHNTIEVEIGGEPTKFSFNLWALKLAKDRGMDLSDAPVNEEEAREGENSLDQMIRLLTIARLPYDEDVTERELAMSVGMGDMAVLAEAYQRIITEQFTDDVRAKVEDLQQEAEESGKVQ